MPDSNSGCEMVSRTGTFFELGDYPDKGFSLNEEEADAALTGFSAVALNVEHVPSIFDGKLGTLQRLWRDGASLMGEFALPKWLHDLTSAEPLKLSAEWDRTTKRPIGAALVLNPRVATAAIMSAAFANNDDAATREGWTVLQDLHDLSATGGACCGETGDANMHASHELTAIQAAHDETKRGGALCSNDPRLPEMRKWAAGPQYFSATTEREKRMNVFERLAAMFTTAAQEAEIAEGAANGAVTGVGAPTAAPPTASADVVRMSAEVAALRTEMRRRDAAEWAAAEIAAGHAMPPEVPSMVAAFMQAAADDEANPATVTFGDGADARQLTRVELLKAQFSARVAHELFRELLLPGTEGGVAFANQMATAEFGVEKPPTEARKAELIAHTPLGQGILRERAAAKNGR